MTTRSNDSGDVSRNMRERVLEVLGLIASDKAQLEYQARAPGVYVSHEIFNQWEDYYRPETEEFSAAFSAEELVLLREFNEVFEQVCAETPSTLPSIDRFIATGAWRRYSEAARSTLVTVQGGRSENLVEGRP